MGYNFYDRAVIEGRLVENMLESDRNDYMNDCYGLKELPDFFQPVDLAGTVCPDVAALWNSYARSYLHDGIYHPDRCVLVRYEDLLQRPVEIYTALADGWLRPRSKHQVRRAPIEEAAKEHGTGLCRDRKEALKHYTRSRRCDGFADSHLAALRDSLDSALLKELGYDAVPVSST